MRKLATTPTLARPPCMWPTMAAANPTSLCVTPQTFTSSPAKMNRGTDTSTKLSSPAVICSENSVNSVGCPVTWESAM